MNVSMADTLNRNAENNNPDVSVQRGTQIILSPGMSKYYIPVCDPALKPFKGQNFKTLEDGIDFYKLYAAAVGFDTRLGSKTKSPDGKIITWRYVYCNREGEKNASNDEIQTDLISVKNKRRRVSRRFGCRARVIFKFNGLQGYVVNEFIEQHTHCLVSDAHKKFLKVNRKLDFVHKKFVMDCARANIGPMKSFRLFKEIIGDYSDVGCTSVEFMNFSRDLKAHVIGVDAQMILDKLFSKRASCPAFSFEYVVDKNDHLTRLFWADPIARKNYSTFGDVVSFDATYSTNRYNMIFAPFTGKDNHGKCVTFGAGLLCKEDIESYEWLLTKFKACMGQEPTLIITDQDPAIKVAVKRALVGTRHRFCMWHIMLKVPEKVPTYLRKDEVFMNRFNSLVWSDFIEPNEFEEEWESIIDDYELAANDWFGMMYDIREYWIPAYFRDFKMAGLCRTTSASESVNNFYSRYLGPTSNLVEFFMHFESALDSQRHANERLNSADESCVPQLQTPLLFEKYAAAIYTTNVFLKVQEEIVSACFVCRVEKVTDHESTREYQVNDCKIGVFTVLLNKSDNSLTCSCKKFIRVGLLCSHVFTIMKDQKFPDIPERYIASRWTKFARSKPIYVMEDSFEEQLVVEEKNKIVVNQLISEFYSCVGLVAGNSENMADLLQSVRELKERFKSSDNTSTTLSKNQKLFDQYYNMSAPSKVSVLPPNQVKNKGSGSRLVSRKEAAIKRMNKPLRTCSKCKEKTNHDARNCSKEAGTAT